MKKLKNFIEFINENNENWEKHQQLDNGEIDTPLGLEDWEKHSMLDNGELQQEDIIDNEDKPEFKEEIDIDVEDEEVDDLLELVYNKRTESWDNIGELDLPSDFEVFQEWFMDEISDDDTTTASMKEEEENDEVVFHIPEDIYIKYLEEIESGYKDELDDIAQSDDFDENENNWED